MNKAPDQNLLARDEIARQINDVSLSKALENFAQELAGAEAICVNLEEILSDRIVDGSTVNGFAQVELQNIDRLLQLLTDFQGFAGALAKIAPPQVVSFDDVAPALIMDDLKRRLFSSATRTETVGQPHSDITFF